MSILLLIRGALKRACYESAWVAATLFLSKWVLHVKLDCASFFRLTLFASTLSLVCSFSHFRDTLFPAIQIRTTPISKLNEQDPLVLKPFNVFLSYLKNVTLFFGSLL